LAESGFEAVQAWTDRDGYTWSIEMAYAMETSVDTLNAKPGQADVKARTVGVARLTNTTPGRAAPGKDLSSYTHPDLVIAVPLAWYDPASLEALGYQPTAADSDCTLEHENHLCRAGIKRAMEAVPPLQPDASAIIPIKQEVATFHIDETVAAPVSDILSHPKAWTWESDRTEFHYNVFIDGQVKSFPKVMTQCEALGFGNSYSGDYELVDEYGNERKWYACL
jgi:hypothetical protein